MDTSKLKKFAQAARKDMLEQVESRLSLVLDPESVARRELPAVVNETEQAINEKGKQLLIDQVAYIWFNRFCALRFMDMNGYSRSGVVSPLKSQVLPEILVEAKAGLIDGITIDSKVAEKIRGFLNDSIPSPNGQAEAYRLLIVASCNEHYKLMPYMFESIQDYTELLMPDDLLSDKSILAELRKVMTKDTCKDVEIIGWLYQFYISEKKDQVFAALKKNQKIKPENIPAATQLFTPHWIVRYLVENSLGRLWLLNRPVSRLAERMDYYIAPEESETDFLRINSPEEIRICDPACGSGHMLTYAFDLLYAIYEEEGYDANEIPDLVLTHNLTGIEIDDRAGALAAFALAMKAAAKLGQRRFLRMEVKPDICVLQNVTFTEVEMQYVAALVGKDLFTDELRETLGQFQQAKNLGSLIVPKLRDPTEALRVVEARNTGGALLLAELQRRVVTVLHMIEALSPKYHVVVANPPYMGGKGMNGGLRDYAKKRYPNSKSDLFAMFIERGLRFVSQLGYSAMVTMQSWMFLSSYEKLRAKLAKNSSISAMIHMGNMVMGIAFGTSGTVWKLSGKPSERGAFCYIGSGDLDANGKPSMFPPTNKRNTLVADYGRFHRISTNDLIKIPGSPIAYWATPIQRSVFAKFPSLGNCSHVKQGLATANNDLFVRTWHEVTLNGFRPDCHSINDAKFSGAKWFPYNKGGRFRKWYGNQKCVVNWQNDGQQIRNFTDEKGKLRSRPQNTNFFFRSSISWSKISSEPSFRYFPNGFVFDVAGTSIFTDDPDHAFDLLGVCNSKIAVEILATISPTLNFEVGHIASIPIISCSSVATELAKSAMEISKSDWDAYETSWGFTTLPLLSPEHSDKTLEATYASLRSYWQDMTDEMHRLEEENNRIFIDAYGMQDELMPKVPIEKISLTCNPAYRYGMKGSEGDREKHLLADTMAEFISYAVGCMFGRYSLEEPGLILANQGDTLTEYLKQVLEPSFMPDDDNVIPMIDFDGDWFEDDISERFKEFLRVTFEEHNYSKNLSFIEDAIGKSVHKYFVKDFYNDHVRRYQKRPVYWLFSSPQGTFNVLIYLHRYRPDTVSVVLNEYLREFRTKLEMRKASFEQTTIITSASQKEKTQALKMIDKINKAIGEVDDYERGILYPLAGKSIEINLDDGVKHNYPLFDKALKNISGLDRRDTE